jgi:multidrug efflux pump subunit AcrA (membrane-fusion protein)
MKTRFFPLILSIAVCALAQEHKHPHDDAPDTQAATAQSGPVRLTQMMVQNIGLETAEVELRPMEKTFPALGSVDPEPGKVAAIASRVAGRVTQLTVHDGQRVKAGEVLLEVESRVVADPPPRLTFKAPMAGVVLETNVILGGTVEPDRNLLTIIDLSEVDVVAQIFEAQIGAVKLGQSVRIKAIAFPDVTFTGKVKTTAASLSRDSGTLRVFVHTENPEGKLLPGMRAQLAFITEETDAAVVVPRAAVLGEAGDLFVYRQIMTAPFAYERTPVVIGMRDDRFIEIIEGVLPGDLVVTRGNYQLQYVSSGGGAQTIEDDHGHSHGPGGHKH